MEGRTLPRGIYDAARQEFVRDWRSWSERVSVPSSMLEDFPNAIDGVWVRDVPQQCKY